MIKLKMITVYLRSPLIYLILQMKKLRPREMKWIVKISRLAGGEIGIWIQAVWPLSWFTLRFELQLRLVSALWLFCWQHLSSILSFYAI